MSNTTHRPATFTEANAWVHLTLDQFNRHFPYVSMIWQAQDGRVWVEITEGSKRDRGELAWWERGQNRSRKPVLPCGCLIRVAYVPSQGQTICTFSNPAIGFRTKLRISGRLMLSAGSLSSLKDRLCVHPHDEATVELSLRSSLAESRGRSTSGRMPWRGFGDGSGSFEVELAAAG